jgi:membrane protein YqaA with SNARE-associated domain
VVGGGPETNGDHPPAAVDRPPPPTTRHRPLTTTQPVSFFHGAFAFFLTWWGAFLLAALDSSMLFFLPFGNDALVVYLAARNRELFWLYPLIVTAGSIAGAAGTFWIGRKAGEVGLERLVSPRRLERVRSRVKDSGAIAMALPAVLPPPFPLTPFILACGALEVDWWRFFLTFGLVRLLRFGAEGVLAHRYGRGVLRVLESDTFQTVVVGFIVLAVVGTIASGVMLWRKTRDRRPVPA